MTTAVATKTVKVATSNKKLLAFLNDQDTRGRFLLSIGAITQDQFDSGAHSRDDFQVKVLSDKALAKRFKKDPEETFADAEGADPDTLAAINDANGGPEDNPMDVFQAMGFEGPGDDDENLIEANDNKDDDAGFDIWGC